MLRHISLALLLLACLGIAVGSAAERDPNQLNGRWVVDIERSRALEGLDPDRTIADPERVVEIDTARRLLRVFPFGYKEAKPESEYTITAVDVSGSRAVLHIESIGPSAIDILDDYTLLLREEMIILTRLRP